MEKKKYVIIRASNLDELEERVNNQVRLGYRPFWTLYSSSEATYIQPMIDNSLSDIKIEEIGNIKKGTIVSTNTWSVQVSGTITVNE